MELQKVDKYNFPYLPLIKGYKFVGWDNYQYEIENAIDNIDVHPIYISNERPYGKIEVTFLTSNSGSVIDSKYVDRFSILDYPTPKDEKDLEFMGWSVNQKGFEQYSKEYYEEIFIIARYRSIYRQPNCYNVRFLGYDDCVIDEQVVTSDMEINYPYQDEAYIPGYQFIGWDTFITPTTKDLEIRALYEKIDINQFHEVCFIGLDVKIIIHEIIPVNGYIDINNITSMAQIEGYIFRGWDKTFDEIVYSQDDVVVRAIYLDISSLPEHKVTFIDRNKQIIKEITLKYGEEFTFPEPTQYTNLVYY